MSRIGKLPIKIPAGVNVTMEGRVVVVNGKLGKLTFNIPEPAQLKIEDQEIIVSIGDENFGNIHGLVRSLVANMVKGVSEGFTKSLELNGTGYKASSNGTELQLALGFSHPVTVKAPVGITFEVKDNKITVLGADKGMVGEITAKIRALRPADPYKLKGFKYVGEVIIKKVGKAVKAAA